MDETIRSGDTIGFRMPDRPNEIWTGDTMASLIGQDITVTFQGIRWEGRIWAAHRYEDELLGPGVWIEVEVGNG